MSPNQAFIVLCFVVLSSCAKAPQASGVKVVPAGQARPPGEHVLTCHTPFGNGSEAPQSADYHSLIVNKVENGFYAEVRKAVGAKVTNLPEDNVIDRATGVLSSKSGKVTFTNQSGAALATLTYEGLKPVEGVVAALNGGYRDDMNYPAAEPVDQAEESPGNNGRIESPNGTVIADGAGKLSFTGSELVRSLECLYSAPKEKYEVK